MQEGIGQATAANEVDRHEVRLRDVHNGGGGNAGVGVAEEPIRVATGPLEHLADDGSQLIEVDAACVGRRFDDALKRSPGRVRGVGVVKPLEYLSCDLPCRGAGSARVTKPCCEGFESLPCRHVGGAEIELHRDRSPREPLDALPLRTVMQEHLEQPGLRPRIQRWPRPVTFAGRLPQRVIKQPERRPVPDQSLGDRMPGRGGRRQHPIDCDWCLVLAHGHGNYTAFVYVFGWRRAVRRPTIDAGPGRPAGDTERRRGKTMAKSAAPGVPEEWGNWLALGAALARVGLLPKGWQKTLAGAAAFVWWMSRF